MDCIGELLKRGTLGARLTYWRSPAAQSAVRCNAWLGRVGGML